MTLKKAAFLAQVGMVLLTVLVTGGFIITISGVLRGIVPAMTPMMSLVHLFASVAVIIRCFLHVSQIAALMMLLGPGGRC